MNLISNVARFLFSTFTVTAVLDGCNISGSQSSAFGHAGTSTGSLAASLLASSDRPSAAAGELAPPHPDRQKSWISGDVKRAHRLLFVTDSNADDVYIFTMPDLSLKGTVTGFNDPQGDCADAAGNIWVANTEGYEMLKVSRTGKVSEALVDPTGYPIACAIDPTTGNLAVANIFTYSYTAGEILIYKHAAGIPTAYSNPSQAEYFFDGYDRSGNLYTDGLTFNKTFILSELSKGGQSMRTVNISGGSIYFPGMVQSYSTGRLAVGDQRCNNANTSCVYRMSMVQAGQSTA
jgi:hypothetical protein